MKVAPLLGLMLLLSALPSASAAVPPRSPTGRWVIDYAPHQCLATRDYGTARDPLILAIKPSPMGELVQLSVVFKGDGVDGIEERGELRFDGEPPLEWRLLAYEAKEKGTRVLRFNLPTDKFEPMRKAKTLLVKAVSEIEESFVLTQMQAVMAEMDRCLADLKRHWNVGEAAQAKLKKRAKANLARFLRDRDYPAQAVFNEESGTVAFMLLVDESGRIADCMVTATSNAPALDKQSCAALQERARFEPAIGEDGKPARDAVWSRVKWVLPD